MQWRLYISGLTKFKLISNGMNICETNVSVNFE